MPLYSDEELVTRAAGLRDEQDKWNDVFATKLIEVLDKIDSVRSEVDGELKRAQRERIAVDEVEGAQQSLVAFRSEIPRLRSSLKAQLAEVEVLRTHFQTDVAEVDRYKGASAKAYQQLEAAAFERRASLTELQSANDLVKQANEALDVAGKEHRSASLKLCEASEKMRRSEQKELASTAAYQVAIRAYRRFVRLSIATVVAITVSTLATTVVGYFRPNRGPQALMYLTVVLCLTSCAWAICLRKVGEDHEA